MERGRRARIPERGDVHASTIARLLDLTLADFEHLLPQLRSRGFPQADPTTGRYCIEAVDRWRKLRYPAQFPELTAAPTAINAAAVFQTRLAKIGGPSG
jgi:hypothetical protein